jgi:hypothetical protein
LEDILPAAGRMTFPRDETNRVLYVVHGGIGIADRAFTDDEAWHARGGATIEAGSSGATLWRYELASLGSSAMTLAHEVGRSSLKLARPIALPGSEVLMRNDSVSFPAGGCAFLHTHQGPGIRCLLEGGIRIDTEGTSISYGPGGAWFEGGPEPVFAQAAADRPSRFIRVMILPATLVGKSSISYVNAEDRERPKSQQYKGYIDLPINVLPLQAH